MATSSTSSETESSSSEKPTPLAGPIAPPVDSTGTEGVGLKTGISPDNSNKPNSAGSGAAATSSQPKQRMVVAPGIATSSKPASVAQASQISDSGDYVDFIKNVMTNETIILPNGKQYRFRKSCERVTDPAIIKGLRQVATKYSIFEKEQ